VGVAFSNGRQLASGTLALVLFLSGTATFAQTPANPTPPPPPPDTTTTVEKPDDVPPAPETQPPSEPPTPAPTKPDAPEQKTEHVPLFVEPIPQQRRGVLAALFVLSQALGGLIGDPLNGLLFDLFGSYRPLFLMMVGYTVCAFVAVLFVPRGAGEADTGPAVEQATPEKMGAITPARAAT